MKWIERYLLFSLLPRWLRRVSKPLRAALTDVILRLNIEAQKTSNPYDNMAVGLLAEILLIDLNDPLHSEEKNGNK